MEQWLVILLELGLVIVGAGIGWNIGKIISILLWGEDEDE